MTDLTSATTCQAKQLLSVSKQQSAGDSEAVYFYTSVSVHYIDPNCADGLSYLNDNERHPHYRLAPSARARHRRHKVRPFVALITYLTDITSRPLGHRRVRRRLSISLISFLKAIITTWLPISPRCSRLPRCQRDYSSMLSPDWRFLIQML